MTTRVKLSSKHQIAVPAAVRQRLGLDAGDYLLVEILDGVIVLIPESADPVNELRGLSREMWEGVDAQAYVAGERDGW